jgi:hypothetical protein
MREHDPEKEIAIYWHVDDVKIINDNLNDDQCLAVLQYCKKYHDANCGINWDALSYAIDDLFPEIENSLQLNHKLYLRNTQ